MSEPPRPPHAPIAAMVAAVDAGLARLRAMALRVCDEDRRALALAVGRAEAMRQLGRDSDPGLAPAE